jgi:hypothetical protein
MKGIDYPKAAQPPNYKINETKQKHHQPVED